MKTVIKSKQLIVDAGEPPIPQGVVVVEGDSILEVGAAEAVTIPPDSKVIDCSAETVLPGLIDSHAHITANTRYRATLKEQHHTLDLTTSVLRGSMNLRSDLAAGTTTMRTLGDRDKVELYFRNAIERGEIPGPRLVISIRALRPSHGTAKFLATPADGPVELRKKIRENFSMGAQFVKLFATNVMSGDSDEDYRRGDLTMVPAYTKEELVAAAEEAHTLGMKISAHAIGGPAMRWAMEAGFDSVEHANMMEEQDVAHFVQYGTRLSDPNLQLFFDEETGFPARENYQQQWWREKVMEARERTARYIPQVIEAGVKICLATDSVHSFLWKEPKYLVQLGATTQQALSAVTKNNAELLGMADKIGTLAPGKWADIISVRGNPLEDITVLQNVNLVMKGGKQYQHLL